MRRGRTSFALVSVLAIAGLVRADDGAKKKGDDKAKETQESAHTLRGKRPA